MVLKLYSASFPGAGGGIVALALVEKQIPFEHVLVDLKAKEQKTQEFLAMNPFGQVPVIVSVSQHVSVSFYALIICIGFRKTRGLSSTKAAPSVAILPKDMRIKARRSSQKASGSAPSSSRPLLLS
jgi:hypothetical protein